MSNREYPDVPRVGVGAVVIKDDKVLLVKRGIAPSMGLWAIPGGGLELGETLQEGAEREILEETGVTIRAKLPPVYTFEFIEKDAAGRIHFHYVIVDLLADYISGEALGADDVDEACWLTARELNGLNVSQNTLRLLRAVQFIRD
ncbi:MAG: NUDIX hydrolase [Deltaproteobacteria bacterium]|nr:NUDIX hydrolase [Deltaproteobacteria bacterium]